MVNNLQSDITTDILHKLCRNETINLTQHFQTRCKERGISFKDVKHVISTGEIIEMYPEDYPNPSCLVLGVDLDQKPLHVVVGVENGFLWLITAYHPDTIKWNANFKTRKER